MFWKAGFLKDILNISEFKEPIIMTSKASLTTEVISQAES